LIRNGRSKALVLVDLFPGVAAMSPTKCKVDGEIEVERCFESSRLEEELLAEAYEIVAPISIASACARPRPARCAMRFRREINREFQRSEGVGI